MIKAACTGFLGVVLAFTVLRISSGRTVFTGGSEGFLTRNPSTWGGTGNGVLVTPLTASELDHVNNILVRSRRSLTVNAVAAGDTLAAVRAGLLEQLARLPRDVATSLADRALCEGMSVATVTRDDVFDGTGGEGGGRESYVYGATMGSIYTPPLHAVGAAANTPGSRVPGSAVGVAAGEVPVYRAWVKFASTSLERAEEQLSTRTARETKADGTHFCNCWLTWVGCDSCPTYHTTVNEEPVMGLRPLTLGMQEALLRSLRVTNAENMERLGDGDRGSGSSSDSGDGDSDGDGATAVYTLA
jgi:hypothetical protein